MSKAEKIKAKIERLKESLPWGSCASQISMECNCKNEAYNEVLSYINSLEEEPVSKDLEEFAKRESELFGEREYEIDFIDRNALAKGYYWGVKAGTQWQKEQMVEEACKWLELHDSYAVPTNIKVRDLKEHLSSK